MSRPETVLGKRERLARAVRETAKNGGHHLKKFEFTQLDCGSARPFQYEGYVSCKDCVAIATISTCGDPEVDWKDGRLMEYCRRRP